MSLYEASGNIAKAFKELSIRWMNVKTIWTDENAERFESDVMRSLERDLKQAAEGIDSMNQLVQAAKRECSE
ncbi:MAG TPA: hypothetical protein PK402_10300 [Tepidisphaeraceae bacterium]|nr:hypothetical protein [Tepidisphaeraceae bacterium]